MDFKILLAIIILLILTTNVKRLKSLKHNAVQPFNEKLQKIMNTLNQYKHINEVLYVYIEKLIIAFFESNGLKKSKMLYNEILNLLNEMHMDMENDLHKDVLLLETINDLDSYMKSKIVLLAKKKKRYEKYVDSNVLLARNTYDLLI